MTTSQPPRDAANRDLVTIRALSSITSQQAEVISKAVQASGLAWATQTTDDYNGYLSILVEPTINNEGQKSFFISGTTQRLELFEAQDEKLVQLASFTNVEAISAQLLKLIA